MWRTKYSASTLGHVTLGPASDAESITLPLPQGYTVAISKDEEKKPRGLNPSMLTAFVTDATNILPLILLSITLGKWHVKVKILWIELSLQVTPIRKSNVN